MVGEAEALFVQGRCSNLAAASDPSLLIPSLGINMIESGEDQEATPMGDILCDIFSSHEFSHGNLAANSPVQDLFGILDFLDSDNHQEASKFISLIEEESSTCNKNGDNFAEVSHLHELPVLEQESELEPETDHNILNFSFSANPGRPGCSDTNVPQSINSTSLNRSESVSSETKDLRKFTNAKDHAVKNRLKSDSCKSLLQKSKSCQLRSRIHPSDFSESETDQGLDKPKHKRLKALATATSDQGEGDGQQRMTHIAVERNRRKQMNEHLAVLRSLMPGFYVQRGDQASIIGGVIEFIKELQQLLQSLESQKQRKAYCTEVLSPRPSSSPRPPVSPRPLPASPRTPQPGNPYRPKNIQSFMPCTSIDSNFETVKELVANSKSAVADVEVKIAGSNALLKTLSHKIPGQILKIVSALENLSLEILHLNISTIDDTVLNSLTLKIGIECKLSVEELAQAVQQTFSC